MRKLIEQTKIVLNIFCKICVKTFSSVERGPSLVEKTDALWMRKLMLLSCSECISQNYSFCKNSKRNFFFKSRFSIEERYNAEASN